MNDAEKDLAMRVARNMLITLGLKWVVIIGVTKALRKAAEQQ